MKISRLKLCKKIRDPDQQEEVLGYFETFDLIGGNQDIW